MQPALRTYLFLELIPLFFAILGFCRRECLTSETFPSLGYWLKVLSWIKGGMFCANKPRWAKFNSLLEYLVKMKIVLRLIGILSATVLSRVSHGAGISKDSCERSKYIRHYSCGVETYNYCAVSWSWSYTRSAHVVGYINDLNQNHGGDISHWYKYNANANPDAHRNQDLLSYEIVSVGNGNIGSAAVFEADIKVYEKSGNFSRDPKCGVELYRACYVPYIDQACMVINQ